MRLSDFMAPQERRLAALLFTLSLLGLAARGLSRLSPEVEAWLYDAGPDAPGVQASAAPDSSRARPPAVGSGSAPGGSAKPASESGGAGTAPVSVAEREAGGDPLTLDPNLADPSQLETLPGIGPALARRIVAEREAGGPFRSPEDLLRVSGIGPATLARIRDRLRFAGGG